MGVVGGAHTAQDILRHRERDRLVFGAAGGFLKMKKRSCLFERSLKENLKHPSALC